MLPNNFIKIPLRETAGSTTSSRYDFQKHWALCHLLEIHTSNQDYLITFEYHDDVVVFTVGLISFFQVKTNNKSHWTINQLVAIQKTKKNSMIGKMYLHKINFPLNKIVVNFVSNAGYRFKLQGKAKATILQMDVQAKQLSDADDRKIISALNAELKRNNCQDYKDITNFCHTKLSLAEFEEHSLGRLTLFLKNRFSGVDFSVEQVYRTLIDDIKRKSNRQESYATDDDFKKNKCISRSQFDKMIMQVRAIPDSRWVQVSQRLNSEAVSYGTVKALALKWKLLQITKADEGNLSFQQHYQALRAFVNKVEPTIVDDGLYERLKFVMNIYSKQVNLTPLDDEYMEIIFLEALYE